MSFKKNVYVFTLYIISTQAWPWALSILLFIQKWKDRFVLNVIYKETVVADNEFDFGGCRTYIYIYIYIYCVCVCTIQHKIVYIYIYIAHA